MMAQRDPADRFWEKVAVSLFCWEWTARVEDNGYGRFWLDGKPQYAHRVVLELIEGQPVPPYLVVDHTCGNRACVRPSHLEVVPTIENARRALTGKPSNNPSWRKEES